MIEIRCDACKQTILTWRFMLGITPSAVVRGLGEQKPMPEVDLCEQCTAKVLKFLESIDAR